MKTSAFLTAAVIFGFASVVLADEPGEAAEKAIRAYCEKNKVDRSKLESFTLDLIPGTQAFRHVLPPLEAPADSPYAGLPARHAFLIVDTKTGRAIEIKATKYDATICDSTSELFAAMKEAGVKVETTAEATKVLRALYYLDIATQSGTFTLKKADRIVSSRNPNRPDTFDGGVHCWSRGDYIGLRVDKDGYATTLLGGHVK